MFASSSHRYYHHHVFKSLRGNNEDTPQNAVHAAKHYDGKSALDIEEPSRLHEIFREARRLFVVSDCR
jgi:hypothetical protein